MQTINTSFKKHFSQPPNFQGIWVVKQTIKQETLKGMAASNYKDFTDLVLSSQPGVKMTEKIRKNVKLSSFKTINDIIQDCASQSDGSERAKQGSWQWTPAPKIQHYSLDLLMFLDGVLR